MKRPIRFSIWTGGLLLFFCAAGALPAAAQQEPEPTLAVAGPVYDFGTVPQGEPVKHDFLIRNTGESELIIRKILPACGCTAAVVASDRISAGEQTKVKVQFDTSGFRGYKVKTVRLYTNDPKQTSSVLTLQGTVTPEIELQPQRLNFGTIRKGMSPSDEVTVRSSVDGFAVTSVKARSEELIVEKEELPSDGVRLKISLKDTVPVGIFRSRIAVRTNNPNTPVVNIPVFAKVRGDLALSSSSVSYGLLEGPLQQSVRKEVYVTNSSDQAIRILSVKSDHPNVSAEVAELEPGKKYAIRVLLEGKDAGAVRAKVRITTDHTDPEQQKLVLPVYAIVTRNNA